MREKLEQLLEDWRTRHETNLKNARDWVDCPVQEEQGRMAYGRAYALELCIDELEEVIKNA